MTERAEGALGRHAGRMELGAPGLVTGVAEPRQALCALRVLVAVVLTRVRMLPAVVADVADAIAVGVVLSGVGAIARIVARGGRAVVARVGDGVAVLVGRILVRVGVIGADVARVAEAIAVAVGLVVLDAGAVVTESVEETVAIVVVVHATGTEQAHGLTTANRRSPR
ncbi:MAG: hypothetical protein K8H88_16280 [Sandaracinaceae bacterium]|nr:hypothetical protein [Sandaracinaceae bacterium]